MSIDPRCFHSGVALVKGQANDPRRDDVDDSGKITAHGEVTRKRQFGGNFPVAHDSTRAANVNLGSNAMKFILHDFQEGSDNPLDGTQVVDSGKLRDIFDQLQQRDPFILELEGDNGYRLTFGSGGPVSCVQHSSSDGDPPYMVAVMKDALHRSERKDCVFLCGGQATEIRGSQCVPFSVLQSVASHFLETGTCSDEVDWIEV